MKTRFISLFAGASALVLLSGCGDSQESTGAATGGGSGAAAPAKTTETSSAVSSAVNGTVTAVTETAKTTGDEAARIAEKAKKEMQEAAAAAESTMKDAGAAAQETVDKLVAQVKSLIEEGKGAEALDQIKSAVGNLKLSPEQQAKVDDLLKKAQEMLSQDGMKKAADAVGGLLQPKPKEN